MTINVADQVGGGLVELALCLRQVNAMALVLEKHFGAEHALVKQVTSMHALGSEGFKNLCEGLVREGLLDGELPPEVKATLQ